jgi:hypothetical protein
MSFAGLLTGCAADQPHQTCVQQLHTSRDDLICRHHVKPGTCCARSTQCSPCCAVLCCCLCRGGPAPAHLRAPLQACQHRQGRPGVRRCCCCCCWQGGHHTRGGLLVSFQGQPPSGVCAVWQQGVSYMSAYTCLSAPASLILRSTLVCAGWPPRNPAAAAAVFAFQRHAGCTVEAGWGQRQQQLTRSRAVHAVTCLVYYLDVSTMVQRWSCLLLYTDKNISKTSYPLNCSSTDISVTRS